MLRIVRPFRFYFHRAEVLDAQGRLLSAIERRFSFLRRCYALSNDADEFGVTYPAEWDVRLKSVLLGAVFLLDFMHFENTNWLPEDLENPAVIPHRHCASR